MKRTLGGNGRNWAREATHQLDVAREEGFQLRTARELEVGEIEAGGNEAGDEGERPEGTGRLEDAGGDNEERFAVTAGMGQGERAGSLVEEDEFERVSRQVHPDFLAPHPVEGGEIAGSKEEIDGREGRPFAGVTGKKPEGMGRAVHLPVPPALWVWLEVVAVDEAAGRGGEGHAPSGAIGVPQYLQAASRHLMYSPHLGQRR